MKKLLLAIIFTAGCGIDWYDPGCYNGMCNYPSGTILGPRICQYEPYNVQAGYMMFAPECFSGNAIFVRDPGCCTEPVYPTWNNMCRPPLHLECM